MVLFRIVFIHYLSCYSVIAIDDFTKKLWDIYETVYKNKDKKKQV